MLDLVFVNDTGNCEIFEPPLPLMNVDRHHSPFVIKHATLDTTSAYREEECFYDFRQCDFDELNRQIASIDWTDILAFGTVDDAVSRFYLELDRIIHRNVPLRQRFVHAKNRRPWWTAELRNLRNRLRKARKRYLRSRGDDQKATVRELERQFNSLNQACFRSHVLRIEKEVKEKPQHLWNYIRQRSSNNEIPRNVFFEDITSSSSTESASLFSCFFQSVSSNNSPPLNEQYLSNLPTFDINIPLISFVEEDVNRKLFHIDASKGSGPDKLLPSFIKACCSSLALPSTLIFNRSLREGCFPEMWKMAAITPIHKAGDIHNVQNYRGISILNCLPKVFESMLLDVVYPLVHHIIPDEQHGFVKKRSTTTNIMSYVSLLIDNIEKRKQVDAIYVDFSKAFDRVPHTLAVEKLNRYGFPTWFTAWIHSYLTGRSAYVRVGSSKSAPFAVASGVPQGSHLGPLLFVLFALDLSTVIKSPKMMYADDLKFFRVVKSLVDCCALQMDVDSLLEWCRENGMDVNIKKCNVISFSRLQSTTTFEYTMGPIVVQRVTAVKDLGVILDIKLRFSQHISSVTAKAFAVLGMIRRNTQAFRDVYCLKTLYVSLVRSILEYGVTVWAPYHAVQIARLERVQKTFLRFALRHLPWRNDRHLPPYEQRCALIKLPTLHSRRKLLQRLLIFDLLNNNIDCPELLGRLRINAPRRPTRRYEFFRHAAHRTQYGQNNPFNVCCQRFNEVYYLFDFNVSKNVFRLRISF